MDLESKSVSSPYHPQNYFADGDVCEWLITAPEGSIIVLQFNYYNVNNLLLFIFNRNLHLVL